MGALADIVLSATDPITALLIAGIYIYLGKLNQRISRLEDVYIPDDPSNIITDD